jgi:hypothetical protein
MESQQLLAEGEIFENEILAGTERTDNPVEEIAEPDDHGKNLTETGVVGLTAKSLISHVHEVLMRHNSDWCAVNPGVFIVFGPTSTYSLSHSY